MFNSTEILKLPNLVSVIVPVYNTADHLQICIESLLQQTHKAIQIILVNDGSTDESESICLRYCEIDSRLIYLKKENGGLSTARNAGLIHAKGEFVGFVDSDDFVSSNFVERLLEACLKHKCGVSACGRWVVYDYKSEVMYKFAEEHLWAESDLMDRFLQWKGLDGSVCDKLFHRSFLPLLNFSPNRISEDLPITCAVLLRSKRLVHVGEALYYYVQRSNSITNNGFFASKLSVLDSTAEVRDMVVQAYPKLKRRAQAYHWQHVLLLQDMIAGNELKFFEARKRLFFEIEADLVTFVASPYISLKSKIKYFVGRYFKASNKSQ